MDSCAGEDVSKNAQVLVISRGYGKELGFPLSGLWAHRGQVWLLSLEALSSFLQSLPWSMLMLSSCEFRPWVGAAAVAFGVTVLCIFSHTKGTTRSSGRRNIFCSPFYIFKDMIIRTSTDGVAEWNDSVGLCSCREGVWGRVISFQTQGHLNDGADKEQDWGCWEKAVRGWEAAGNQKYAGEALVSLNSYSFDLHPFLFPSRAKLQFYSVSSALYLQFLLFMPPSEISGHTCPSQYVTKIQPSFCSFSLYFKNK